MENKQNLPNIQNSEYLANLSGKSNYFLNAFTTSLKKIFKDTTEDSWTLFFCSFSNIIRLFILLSKLLFISVLFLHLTGLSNLFINFFNHSNIFITSSIKFFSVFLLTLLLLYGLWLIPNESIELDIIRSLHKIKNPVTCRNRFTSVYNNKIFDSENFPLFISSIISLSVALFVTLLVFFTYIN